MEDPDEWGTEIYYPCFTGEEESESKVSWIWNKGLKLGKTIVITSVVISSAPLVLPPLVVASALGFAVSVPFGVIFASYACTEKLMSKLLPMPAPSLLLEYDSLLMDEAEAEERDLGWELVMDEEEEKQVEDMKEETEIRLELEGDGYKEHEMGENHLKDVEEVEGKKPYGDESGYEEDVGEYLEREDTGSFSGTNIETKVLMEEFDEKPSIEDNKNEKPSPEVKRVVVVVGGDKKYDDEVAKPAELVVVTRGVKSDIREVEKVPINEHNKIKEGSTGLLEIIRDESNAGESVKKNKKKHKHHHHKSHGHGGKKEDKHGKKTDEKLNEHVGRKGEEAVPDAMKKNRNEADEGVITKVVVADDSSSGMISLKPVENQEMTTDDNHPAKSFKTVEAGQEPISGLQESKVESTGTEGFGSSATRRETDEAVGGNTGTGIGDKNVEASDSPSQAGLPESLHGVKSEADAAIHSNKVHLSEEKIWEQINALRMIVGYGAARQPSCMEELKALYIFTGVEPPSSFGKSTDLKDAEDKLGFLMSIVGVK